MSDIRVCPHHNVPPESGTERHGWWITYCPQERGCELTDVYKTKEESIAAWNRIIDDIPGDEKVWSL